MTILMDNLVWGHESGGLGGPLSGEWKASTVIVRGSNGLGKTTLLRTLAGVLPVVRGRVCVSGFCLRKQPVRARGHLSWMPDHIPVPDTTRVSELIELVRWSKGLADSDADAALWDKFGVTELKNKSLNTCSLGQQRRACLVAALQGEPPVLLMDEPDRGLDSHAIEVLCGQICERNQRGLLTILSTHQEKSFCDQGDNLVFCDLRQGETPIIH